MRRHGFLMGLFAALFWQTTIGCTMFQFESPEGIIVGNNFDYFDGGGFIFVNPVHVNKTAMVYPPDIPFVWESKYGSVTFNPFGRENPVSGMNEKGLVIGVLWLGQTKYPEPDKRFAIGELNWVQYHLDQCETVEEVLRSDAFLRIHRNAVGMMHFFAADSTGDAVVIEFLDGRQIVHRGEDLPYHVVTNSTYQKSLQILELNPLGQKCYNKPMVNPDRDRFEYTLRMVEDFPGDPNSVQYGFKTLKKVSLPENKMNITTQWSIVYDTTGNVVYFKTSQAPTIKTIDLKAISYNCGDPLKVSNIHIEKGGSINQRWEQYDRKRIFEQVKRIISKAWMTEGKFTDDMLEDMIRRPEYFPCSH